MRSPIDRERLALIRNHLDLIDERCDHYETEWNAQRSPLIETYVEGVDGEVRKSLWLELVMIDLFSKRSKRSSIKNRAVPAHSIRRSTSTPRRSV